MGYPVAQSDPTAVFGRRLVATILDTVLIVSLITLLWQSQAVFEPIPDGLDFGSACELVESNIDVSQCLEIGGWRAYYIEDQGVTGAIYLVSFFGSLLIVVILQGLTGWTPGKLVTGIRTVKADGSIVGIPKASVRWILLIVDGQPCGLPLVGFITGLTTQGHRRVGDMAAKTFVVSRAAVGSPIVVPGMTAPPPPDAAWPTPAPSVDTWATPTPPAGGWGTLVPGAAPAAPEPTASWAAPSEAVVPGAAAGEPQPRWDEARGTYIQWDPSQSAWLQWDEPSERWILIEGQ